LSGYRCNRSNSDTYVNKEAHKTTSIANITGHTNGATCCWVVKKHIIVIKSPLYGGLI
jgi:hypothetical protein